MKKMFFQLNHSFVVYVKRLLMLCCVLLTTTVVFGESDKYAKITATIHPMSTGKGTIYASASEQSNQTSEKGTTVVAVGKKKASGAANVAFTLKADAFNYEGNSYFAGWTKDFESLSATIIANNPHTFSISSSNTNADPDVSEAWYAIYNNIISISTTDIRMIKDPTGIAPVTYDITVYDNGELTYSLAGGTNSKFAVDLQSTGDGKYVIQISAKTSATVDDKETITLTATLAGGAATVVLNVSIEETPMITLHTGKNGTYTYMQPGKGMTEGVAVTATQSIEIKDPKEYHFVLTPTPNSGYRFDRWKIENDGDVRYVMSTSFDDELKSGDVVTPEFIEASSAMFILVGEQPQVFYNHLEDAIDKAKSSNNKIIAVYQSGNLAAGNYVIDHDITLLIPGDDDYTCKTSLDGLKSSDYVEGTSGTLKKKLTLSDNTTITVHGNICIYAKLSYTQGPNVRPNSYGQLEMGENCHIILSPNGATKPGLFAYGYITYKGDVKKDNCTITAQSGSVVYESFLISDYRGGRGTQALAVPANNYKVFPAKQYSLNSIEPMLILEAGAEEHLTTGLNVLQVVIANAPFVVPDEKEYTNGLFRLGTGTSLVKYYDAEFDRQKYFIRGSADGNKVQIANIELDLSVSKVNSAEYILPIPPNMDIAIESANVTIPYDIEFLAGSKISIDANSEVAVSSSARVFVYDAQEHEVYQGPTDIHTNLKKGWYNYFNSSNTYLSQLKYRIGNKTQKYNRATNDMIANSATLNPDHYHLNASDATVYTQLAKHDAKIVVNGKLSGPIYTTSGGACITSDAGGEITFTTSSTTTTYQVLQYAGDKSILGTPQKVEYRSIGNTIAKLYNADGSYSAGEAVKANDKYIYYPNLENPNGSKGRWEKPIEAISAIDKPEWVITLPTQSTVCDTVKCTLTQPEGAAPFKATDFDLTCNNNHFKIGISDIVDGKLLIPITYESQDQHGEYSAVLTIKNDAVDLIETVELVAKEDYKPKYGVAALNPFASTVEVPVQVTMPIELTANNVTTIWNDATYGPRLQSIYTISGTNAADFGFEWGDGDNKFSEAEVTFNPKSEGEKEATLTLTIKYTDGNEITKDSILSIPLSGTASLNPNKLTFAPLSAEIFEDSEEFPLFVAGSDNAKTQINITVNPSSTGEVTLSGEGDAIMVTPKAAGVVVLDVYQSASTAVAIFEKSRTITINPKTATLTPLTVCFDEQPIFNAHTITAKSIAFDDANNKVSFTSTVMENSQWTLQYEGIADKFEFTPTGTNQWLIEEATAIDNNDWSTAATWQSYTEGVPIECALKPTSGAVRITYANGESVGTLANICISKLELTANLQKIYLPVNTDNTESSATVIFTHASNTISFSEITELTLEPTTSPNLGTNEHPYYVTTLVVKSNSFTVIDKVYSLTATTTDGTKTIEVRTYAYPQELPINLAIDNIERYNFVVTASAHAHWNAATRQVVFQNTALERSITFSFHGAPSVVAFDLYNATGEVVDVVDNNWIIEGYNGKKWEVANNVNRTIEGNSITQEVNYNWQKIRITYNTTNASEVRLSNIRIEGYPQLIAIPEKLSFTSNVKEQQLALVAINLNNITITSDNGENFKLIYDNNVGKVQEIKANSTLFPEALGVNLADTILLTIVWEGVNIVDEGTITITNDDQGDNVLAVVKLLGAKNYIFQDNATQTGIFTGLAPTYTLHGEEFNDYVYHEVDFTSTFSMDGLALFDCLIVYGVTTTDDETKDVTKPNSTRGSNAKTPYYIYVKAQNDEGVYDRYQFVEAVENANTPNKANSSIVSEDAEKALFIDVQGKSRIYITGFCPYATTGNTKEQEGVWFFRGESGETLDLYLEDCFIFSRNKTKEGHSFRDRNDITSPQFTEGYVRGSGAVFAFENTTYNEVAELDPFEVNIHTKGTNVFKSNHGCFFQLIEGWRAFQISSPIQIHMASERHLRSNASKTSLTFDDIWPIALDENYAMVDSARTNGFISLQKQTNNAPSIDLGSPTTEVNFRGGRVELQNAQVVSTNYKTTLAISYRSGEMGGDGVGFHMAYGIGTDSVGGTVNFYDGTITVIPMKVDPTYRQYYLMDTLENGVESEYTSCLRCPEHTYVYGGSVCRIRACMHVTSKGGAPTDGPDADALPLGQYVYSSDLGYTYKCADNAADNCKLVTLNQFPNGSLFSGLPGYYASRPYHQYGVESITPDANGNVYLWIPDGYAGVEAEEDKLLTTWKACMTEITAGLNSQKGTVGGETYIDTNEEVKYMLYCEIDENIKEIITNKDVINGAETYTYKAPVKVPDPLVNQLGEYMEISPMYVGEEVQNEVVTKTDYTITDKVFYITTATADVWKTFTAPFDVAKMYVVETYSEEALKAVGNRSQILKEQAIHNADFAAFFGVAMAIGTPKNFKQIFDDYLVWAEEKDHGAGLYDPAIHGDKYTLRSMQELTPYYGNNWREANFYLNHNTQKWKLTESVLTQQKDSFAVEWEMLPDTAMEDGILLHKGETYSLLFPYCTGCWDENDRTYWDYWSGKFLIFESVSSPQTIKGSDFLDVNKSGNIFATTYEDDEVIVTGNSTFSFFQPARTDVYAYYPSIGAEGFYPYAVEDIIYPTTAFLYGNVPNEGERVSVKSISRTGKIIYDKDNTATDNNQGGKIPTVGGGNDLFITSTAEGINVAVAQPQYVRVLSASGAVLFSGMVNDNVDVAIYTTGVYVVVGENEVRKIMIE